MFCPACGAQARDGLRFCNHCGANLVPLVKGAPPNLLGLIWLFAIATALVAIAGFFLIFTFGREQMERGNILGSTFIFLVLVLLIVFIIVWLMLRQTSKLLAVYLQQAESAESNPRSGISSGKTRELNEAQQSTAQIPSASVTQTLTAEEMTRKLEDRDKISN